MWIQNIYRQRQGKSHGYKNLIQINHMHTKQTFIEITTAYKTFIEEVYK